VHNFLRKLTQHPQSHIIAICNIVSADDDQNKCTLTHEHLYITQKGKQHAFKLDQITKVSFKQKKLLFPLVLGGVVGSLFLIAGFNFLINIWIAMIVGLAGILLFYYGWIGSQTIAILTNVKEFDIFINQITPPLRGFVKMVNENFIQGKNKTLQYYLTITEATWQQASSNGYVDESPTGHKLLTDERKSEGQLTFLLDQSELPNQIDYLMEESSNEVLPYIFGRIDINHLQDVSN
jgi:hypothetical protein